MATFDLKEIAMKYATKQPLMVDSLTEETPFLERFQWEPASHGLWNMAEEVTDITGPQFVNANAALPTMNVSSDLKKIDLTVLGGEIEVAQDTADQFGGAANYFAKKQNLILKQSGMNTEVHMYYNNFKAKAVDDATYTKCGATSGTVYSIIAIRMEEGVNCGLFDPTGFTRGTLLNAEPINNAARYHLRSLPGVLGYGITLKSRFGWQNLSTRNVYAITNIQSGHLPTQAQIEDAISAIRGTSKNTMLLCHPKCKTLALHPFKISAIQTGVTDKKYDTTFDTFNDIPIITSYNVLDGTETISA